MSEIPKDFTIKSRWFLFRVESNIFKTEDGWMIFSEMDNPLFRTNFGPDEITKDMAYRMYHEYEVIRVKD